MERKTRTALIIIIVTGAMIEAAFLAYAWEAGNHPCWSGYEELNIQSSHINSPTNITLMLFNGGTSETILVSYVVKDSNGDSYSGNFNPQPVLCGVGRVYSVNVVLAGTVTGQLFTFQPKNNYTVDITTRRYQFTLQLTA